MQDVFLTYFYIASVKTFYEDKYDAPHHSLQRQHLQQEIWLLRIGIARLPTSATHVAVSRQNEFNLFFSTFFIKVNKVSTCHHNPFPFFQK